MKRMLCLIFLVFSTGCAGFMSNSIPLPRAGLTLLVNENQGAYAQARLFDGRWRRKDLITVDQEGRPKWAKQSIKKFTVDSSVCKEAANTYPLILTPNSSYTIFIIWTRFHKKGVLGMDVINFSTSNDPYRASHTDMFGQKTYADVIIRLPRVRSRSGNLRFHKDLYLAD